MAAEYTESADERDGRTSMSTTKTLWARLVLWAIGPALALDRRKRVAAVPITALSTDWLNGFQAERGRISNEHPRFTPDQIAVASEFIARRVRDGASKKIVQQDLEILLDGFQRITGFPRPQCSCGQEQAVDRTA